MFAITKDPIDLNEITQTVIRREAGAVITFTGTVREITGDLKTIYLSYESYEEMALKKLRQIGDEMKGKWGNVECSIVHRIGRLEISDIAVVIAVSTPHRQDAYEASRYAIERIKEIVPIWKKEHMEQGEEWVGNQKGTKTYPTGSPSKEDLND